MLYRLENVGIIIYQLSLGKDGEKVRGGRLCVDHFFFAGGILNTL